MRLLYVALGAFFLLLLCAAVVTMATAGTPPMTLTGSGSGAPSDAPFLTNGAVTGLTAEVDITAANDLTFGGVITASGGLTCTDCIALSTETSGNYVASFTAGAGLSGDATGEGSTPTLATASGEAGFLASGALTCGAAASGRMQVHTTPLQYCDNAATPALQYAAYGSSAGAATGVECTDCIALSTETSGNYVASIATSTGLTGGGAGSEGATLTLSCVAASGATTGCVNPNAPPTWASTVWSVNSATTNAVDGLHTFNRETTGTAATGIGTGALYRIESVAGALRNAAEFTVELTDVTDSAEDAKFTWDLISSGALTERMALTDVGDLQIDGDLTVDGSAVALGSGVGIVSTTSSASGLNLYAASAANANNEYGFVGGTTAILDGAGSVDLTATQIGAFGEDLDGSPSYVWSFRAGGALAVTPLSLPSQTSADGLSPYNTAWVTQTGGVTTRTDVAALGGAGANVVFTLGAGGAASGINANQNTGGSGGGFTATAGNGGAATNGTPNVGGAGGAVLLRAGDGGASNGAGGDVTLDAGGANGSGAAGEIFFTVNGTGIAKIQSDYTLGDVISTLQGAVEIDWRDAVNTSIGIPLVLRHTLSSGSGAAGMEVAIAGMLPDASAAAGASELVAAITMGWQTATNGSEAGYITFSTRSGASGADGVWTVRNNGTFESSGATGTSGINCNGKAACGGTITLSGGTGTATVRSGSTCVCSNTSNEAAPKCVVSGTTLTASVGASANVIAYFCF